MVKNSKNHQPRAILMNGNSALKVDKIRQSCPWVAVAASSSAIMNDNVCYIITPGQNKALIIDEKKMKELMADKPDLLEKYMSVGKKKRSNAENVVPLLEEAGLIHRHNPVQ